MMLNLFHAGANYLLRLFAVLIFSASFSVHAAADLPIYTDGLAAGWDDWSWDVAGELANSTPVKSGTQSIAVTVTAAWGALYLHPATPVSTNAYDRLEFWVHGGVRGGQQMQFAVNFESASAVAFTPTANAWTLVSIPLATLGNPASLADFTWQDKGGAAQATFYLDDIVLVAGSGVTPPPSAGPTLSIDVASGRHTINSDIYGINLLSDEALATELRLPLRRWGGNPTSRYNWQNDTYNAAMDWFYENIPLDNANPATLPDGSATDRFVEQNQRTATRSLLTLPTLGWIAKRRTDGHPFDCAFSINKYGAQKDHDYWDPDCGNGVAANGNPITGNAPTDTSVASSPAFMAQWINHLKAKYGTAASGGVSYYAFDNESGIWHSTHRDVHPLPPTYDEIRDRTFAYGAAIKAADPSAKTLGPVEDGWCRYLYSGADQCLAGADYLAHGSVQWVPWYLQQMKGYEQLNGLRILDYLDLHYYPAANGVSLSGAGNAATQALRLRSTRSLWDATYIDESWISDTQVGGVAVNLIPRMKQWVAGNYTGTRLAMTEYNWGAPESINGALAQADVLGIFGREGLDMAVFWGDVLAVQPLSFAFRMYRNYDGLGHGFGDTAVQSVSADQSALAVYAAQRSADGALTIMVVNKSASALISSLALAGFSPQALASVYRYSPANLAAIEHAADQAVTAGGLNATFPASSITLFVLSANASSLLNTSLNYNVTSGDDGVTRAATAQVTHLDNFGAEKRPVVLLMPGWGGTGDVAAARDAQALMFANQGYVAVNVGFHQTGSAPGGGLTVWYSDLAESVKAALDALCAPPQSDADCSAVVLLGESYGGTQTHPVLRYLRGNGVFDGSGGANAGRKVLAFLGQDSGYSRYWSAPQDADAMAYSIALIQNLGDTTFPTDSCDGAGNCGARNRADYHQHAAGSGNVLSYCPAGGEHGTRGYADWDNWVLSAVKTMLHKQRGVAPFTGYAEPTLAVSNACVTSSASISITASASPPAGGTVSCTPNPVTYGASSTCTATPNAGYTFSTWRGDCTGATCILSNVTAAQSVTATFLTVPLTCTLSASPSVIARGASSTLTASCNPAATSYTWTGDTCAGNVLASCTVTPTRTTSYGVIGINVSGASAVANARVTVRTLDLTPILMLLLD